MELVLLVPLVACSPDSATASLPPDEPTVSFGNIVAFETEVAKEPAPVRGTDGRIHLVYEIDLVNTAPAPQQLTLVEVMNAQGDQVLLRFDTPEKLRAVMRDDGPDELAPTAASVLFINLAVDTPEAVPAQLAHRFESRIGPANLAYRGALVEVSKHEAVRLSPPLVGPGYMIENGCCDRSNHTRAVLSVDGARWLAQRFADDWVRIDDQKRPYVGDWRINDNWLIFGDPVVSASEGQVVETLGNLPENTPPTPAGDLTPFTALGNHVIVDMGGGRFALYAHLQPASVAVNVGDRVRPGQLLGRVGNTGSSTAPHLHFHVTDAAPAVASNGTPWVFDDFGYVGRATNTDELNADDPPGPVAAVESVPPPARRTGEMPLTGDVVDFPGSREAQVQPTR
jgi:murein DD-endopeptidase MepM/ murein hydrolase activator NlpD